MSATAARQRVSRAGEPVQRLVGIRFPNREKFLFLEGQYASKAFSERLAEALISARTAFGRALIGLRSRSGLIQERWFPVASGCPVKPARGQLSHAFVVEQLQRLKLICPPDEDGFLCLDSFDLNWAKARAVRVAENILLARLKVHFIRAGWTSKTAQDRSSPTVPSVGQYAWDFAGPCYLAGIRRQRRGQGPQNGFLCGDVLLGHDEAGPDEIWP